MKRREQHRNNKRTEIERLDWFIERIQTRVAFGWLSGAQELSRNQLILCSLADKQITNTYRNHFSRLYENRSNCVLNKIRLLF